MCPPLLPLRQEETTAEIHKNQWIVTRGKFEKNNHNKNERRH
jgi:hypothetical protein